MSTAANASSVDCVTLWIGDSLGVVERACLRSVLRQGHGIALYCYHVPQGVPRGIELRDAAQILPEKLIFHHGNGSVAVFADWFRYELQRRGLGTWIDTDNYLINRLELHEPYLFAEYEPGRIANGVLRLPSDSPMLAALLDIFERPTTPSWLPWFSYLPARTRELLSGKADLARLPWGTTGPFAMTAHAKRFGLASKAVPMEVFNPVPWQQASWITDPDVSLNDVVTERTVGIHLWNQCIKTFKDKKAPDGSFLDRLQREGSE